MSTLNLCPEWQVLSQAFFNEAEM